MYEVYHKNYITIYVYKCHKHQRVFFKKGNDIFVAKEDIYNFQRNHTMHSVNRKIEFFDLSHQLHNCCIHSLASPKVKKFKIKIKNSIFFKRQIFKKLFSSETAFEAKKS